MARLTLPDSNDPPSDYILSLDKSEESWQQQVTRAMELLGIDFIAATEKSLEENTTPRTSLALDPPADFALRWLLKRMEPVERKTSEQCKTYTSWVLLQELVKRLPAAVVAKYLRNHGFINILATTLSWLRDEAGKDLAKEGPFKPFPSPQSSQSPTPEVSRSSRKRKRDESTSPSAATEVETFGEIDILFTAICGSLRQVVLLTRKECVGPKEYDAEVMKSTLKAAPEVMAEILGCAFHLVNYFLQVPVRRSRQNQSALFGLETGLEEVAYEPCLVSLFRLWELRSAKSPRTPSEQIDRAFETACTVPSLHLLRLCEEWSCDEEAMTKVFEKVERLLTDHVILPIRSSLLDQHQSKKEGNSALPFTDTLIKQFQERIFVRRSSLTPLELKAKTKNRQEDKDQHVQMTLVSLFYRLAVKSRPRHTQKLRQTEGPWLERLFCELDRTVALLQPSDDKASVQKCHKRFFKWMLGTVRDNDVQIKGSVMQDILRKSTGLLKNQIHDQLEWDQVCLILAIDVDVFVAPDWIEGRKTFNPFLTGLLTALTNYEPSDKAERQNIFQTATHPLIRGFVRARDLTGFIGHWEEQLCAVQRKDTQNYTSPALSTKGNLWEDEDVICGVADQIHSLTPTQIRDLVLDRQKTHEKVSFKPWSTCLILESVFRGIRKDEDADMSADSAKAAFDLVFDHRLILTDLRVKWRSWTALTAIVQRFPIAKASLCKAVESALELLGSIPVWTAQPDGNPKSYREHCYAFQFVLGATKSRQVLEDAPFHDQIMQEAVSKILAIMSPFYERLQNDLWQNLKPSKDRMVHFRPGGNIVSVEGLYLGCIASILTRPNTLSSLKTPTCNALVDQAYGCALYQQRSPVKPSATAIDFAWPWQQLLRVLPLCEEAETYKYVRNLQITKYLAASEFRDPKYFNIGSADHTLAFRSVATIPTKDLTKGLRVKLADRVLRTLIHGHISSASDTYEHLVALSKLTSTYNRNCGLLKNCEPVLDGEPRRNDQSILFRLANIVMHPLKWQDSRAEALDAFQQLTRLTMKYLMSSIDRQESEDHVIALLYEVRAEMNKLYEPKRSHTTISVIAGELLHALREHTDSLPIEVLEAADDPDLRQSHLRRLLCILRTAATRGGGDRVKLDSVKRRHELGITLEYLVGYVDLLKHQVYTSVDTQWLSHLGMISRKVYELKQKPDLSTEGLATPDICGLEYLAVRLARLDLALQHGSEGLMPTILETARMLNFHDSGISSFDPIDAEGSRRFALRSQKARNEVMLSLQSTISSLRPEDTIKLVGHFDESTNLPEGHLYILRTLILSLPTTPPPDLQTSIAHTIGTLYQCFWPADISHHRTILIMQCLAAFFPHHPRLVTQWHADNLLTTISVMGSSLAPNRTAPESALLYTSLSRLFTTLLRAHRTRIGGRHHLVLSALSPLLRCLFVPYAFSPDEPAPEASVFTEQHAEEYARVLTMLCDPNVSSVSQKRKRDGSELNDETKKARRIAGQHLQHWVVEYCDCLLKGRLEPGVREKLRVGIWSVLSVIGEDVRRNMVSGMNEEQRSVFQGVFAEWKRFGKWGGG